MSSPGDASEREAERVADDVMRARRTAAAPGVRPSEESKPVARVRRAGATPGAPVVERKDPAEMTEKLGRATNPGATTPGSVPAGEGLEQAGVSGGVEERIAAQRGSGEAMPEAMRAELEGELGADLSAVRVHRDGEAAQLCDELRARAFTVGSDIFFAAGQFDPLCDDGRHLLVHELTHVLQGDEGASRVHRRAADVRAEPAHVSPSSEQRREPRQRAREAVEPPAPLASYGSANGEGDDEDEPGEPTASPGPLDVVALTREALRVRGRRPVALAHFVHAVDREPLSALAWVNLGRARLASGHVLDAEGAFRRAVALEPENPAWLVRHGTTLALAGRLEQGLEVLERACELAPSSADAAAQLGVALLLRGDPSRAGKQLARALELAPDHPLAREYSGR